MKLNVRDENSPNRNPAEVRAMAVAVQANLVQLLVAESKRCGRRPIDHDIKVFSPGHVKHCRETLIDQKTIAGYSDLELHLRLREIWGRFCLMRWLFSLTESDTPVSFAGLPDDMEMHCETALQIKCAEVRAFLWKMLFEQRRRTDPDYVRSPLFSEDASVAKRIPAAGFGKPIEQLTDEELLYTSCEHAGMLAAVRWVLDKRLAWNAPDIMQADRPEVAP